MTVYEDIQQALETHLLAFPDLPVRQDNGDPAVGWENTTYQPEAGRLWLRPQLFCREVPKGGIGASGTVTIFGMYYLAIMAPGGRGAQPSNDLAGTLLHHFRTGQTLVAPTGPHTVRLRKCWRESAIVENAGWYLLPVVVEWYCHTESL